MRVVIILIAAALLNAGCNTPVETVIVTLKASSELSGTGITEAISELHTERYPGTTIKVVSESNDELVGAASSGSDDPRVIVLFFSPYPEDETADVYPGEVLAYEELLIVGPAEDRAGVGSAPDAVEAFARILSSGESFVAPPVNSTASRVESSIWAEVGSSPSDDNYISSENEAAQTESVVNASGYSLINNASFASVMDESTSATILLTGDPRLFVEVRAMTLERGEPSLTTQDFLEWLLSPVTGNRIESRIALEGGFAKYPMSLVPPDLISTQSPELTSVENGQEFSHDPGLVGGGVDGLDREDLGTGDSALP